MWHHPIIVYHCLNTLGSALESLGALWHKTFSWLAFLANTDANTQTEHESLSQWQDVTGEIVISLSSLSQCWCFTSYEIWIVMVGWDQCRQHWWNLQDCQIGSKRSSCRKGWNDVTGWLKLRMNLDGYERIMLDDDLSFVLLPGSIVVKWHWQNAMADIPDNYWLPPGSSEHHGESSK